MVDSGAYPGPGKTVVNKISRELNDFHRIVNKNSDQTGWFGACHSIGGLADIEAVLKLPGLTVRGLMTMAPMVDEAEIVRPVFAALRGLRDALANDFPAVVWSDLSMGMTDDYPVAVQEGATLVRIGRALFGARP